MGGRASERCTVQYIVQYWSRKGGSGRSRNNTPRKTILAKEGRVEGMRERERGGMKDESLPLPERCFLCSDGH